MRRSVRSCGILLLLTLASVSTARSQSWSIDLVARGQGAGVGTTTLNANGFNEVTDPQAAVTVRCGTGLDCSRVRLEISREGATLTALTPSGDPPTFTVRRDLADRTALSVSFGGELVERYLLAMGSAASGTRLTSDDVVTPVTRPLIELISHPCPVTGNAVYDAPGNRGQVVVTPTGMVLGRGTKTFDENDELEVTVVAHKSLIPLLKVQRKSPFGTGEIRIIGADQQIPVDSKIARQSAGSETCGQARFTLANFAPGRGEVQISIQSGTTDTAVGSFDFRVNPLYVGIFSLGGVWTDLVDPDFGLVSDGTDTLIAPRQQGDNEYLYSVMFTPFVWGKRDIEKAPDAGEWWKRVNPSFGVILDDIDDHGLLGVTVDLPRGFLLTYGRHFRRVSVLDPSAGLVVGDVFTGSADQLPVAHSWEDDAFLSVSIDLRIAVKLFTAAFRAGGGK